MAMRPPRLRVRTRFYAGFGMLIVLAMGVAGLATERLAQVRSQVVNMNTAARYTTLLNEIVLRLEAIENTTSRVKLDENETAPKTVRDSLGKISQLLSQQPKEVLPIEQQQALQSLQKSLQAYADQFSHIVQLEDKAAEMRDKLLAGNGTFLEAVANLVEQAHAASNLQINAAASAFERADFKLQQDRQEFLRTGDLSSRTAIAADREDAAAKLNVLTQVADAPTRALAVSVSNTFVQRAQYFDNAMAARLEANNLFYQFMLPSIIAIENDAKKIQEAQQTSFAVADRSIGDTLDAATTLQVALAGATIILSLTLAFLLSRSILMPLNSMTRTMAALAGGDLSIDIPARDRTDELGDMARAVEVFKLNKIRADVLTSQKAQAESRKVARQEEMDRTAMEFGEDVGKIMNTLMEFASGMYHAAGEMTAASASMHDESSTTSEGAKRSSDNLTKVAASVDALTAGFDGTTREVTTAADVSQQAVQQVEASQEAIRGLADSTALIGDVVQLINNIAGQTNLLALNATIEAARAGEAGKGFAVVAGEVKALAGQTARATAEISSQIDNVRQSTEATIAAMTEIGAMIGRMNNAASAVVHAVNHQSLITHEVAASIKTVSADIERSAGDMAQVIAIADQQAVKASENLLFGVTDIGQEVDNLRDIVDKFIDAVRTEAAERRRFERVDGYGAQASLQWPGQNAVKVTIKDLSLGGAAFWTELPIPPDTEITVELPDIDGEVKARVIRSSAGALSVQFNENPETRARVENAFLRLSGSPLETSPSPTDLAASAA